jgi:hypothetical protein
MLSKACSLSAESNWTNADMAWGNLLHSVAGPNCQSWAVFVFALDLTVAVQADRDIQPVVAATEHRLTTGSGRAGGHICESIML